MAGISDPRLIVLMNEVWQRFEDVQGNERETLNLVSSVRKSLGMTGDELVDLMEKSGYIQKSAEPKTDPVPGPMKRLPLVDALARVSVHLVNINESTGWELQCLRCGNRWSPAGYTAGDVMRPADKRNFWKCPVGCNASAGPLLWDENQPLSYNPLHGYK